jgi:hypothetical protein
MRITARSWLLVMLVTVSAACDPPPPPAGHTPTTPPITAPTAERSTLTDSRLAAALLTPAEVPNGPYVDMPTAQNQLAVGLNGGVEGCANAGPPLSPRTRAQAVYQGGGGMGPFFIESITVSTVPDAVLRMSELARIATNCGQFSGSAGQGGLELEVTISQLAFPTVADGVAAFRLTGTIENAGAALYMHVVNVRAGDMIMQVAYMQMLSTVDVTVTQQIVGDALAKARRVLG